MTFEEFEYLKSPEARELINSHISDNPLDMALSGINSAVCTQVKYLQRASRKLPHYYKARCIIVPLSFEQSSSYASSSTKNFGGDTAVDLTCGLGVDAAKLSTQFRRVIAIEKNEFYAAIARYNFSLLGVQNIEVICGDSSELVLSRLNLSHVDLVYVDPARRDEGKKVFLFEDCSPNILDLMEAIKGWASTVVIKASPLFDVIEAYRLFSGYGRVCVESLSVDGECKEVVISVNTSLDCGDSEDCEDCEEPKTLKVTIACSASLNFASYTFTLLDSYLTCSKLKNLPSNIKYLYIADVAFYKSRTFVALFNSFNVTQGVLTSSSGVVLSEGIITDFPGKSYSIISAQPYKPKVLKSFLAGLGIRRATIIKRNMVQSQASIFGALSLTSGGDAIIVICDNFFFLAE